MNKNLPALLKKRREAREERARPKSVMWPDDGKQVQQDRAALLREFLPVKVTYTKASS